VPATLHFQFATYGNRSQTTWRGDAFVNEAFDFIFYFAAELHFFLFFIFRQRQDPHLSVRASGSVRE
jgi:hypothetical protein